MQAKHFTVAYFKVVAVFAPRGFLQNGCDSLAVAMPICAYIPQPKKCSVAMLKFHFSMCTTLAFVSVYLQVVTFERAKILSCSRLALSLIMTTRTHNLVTKKT